MARRISLTRTSRTSRHVTLVSRHAFCVLSGISERQLEVWEREEFIGPRDVGDSRRATSHSTIVRRCAAPV